MPSIRLPRPGEQGTEFIDLLDQRVADRRTRQMLVAFIQEWDHLRDELEREPTVVDYAQRWRTPESTVFRWLAEFRRVFDTEGHPGEVSQVLWDAMPRTGELRPLLSARVIFD